VSQVFNPTVYDVAEIYITRASLEAQAGAIVSNIITESFLTELNEIINKSRKAYEINDVNLITKYNTDFHMKIVNFSENQYLIKTMEAMYLQIMQARRSSLKRKEHRIRSLNEHKGIIEHFKNGNKKEIKQVLSSHIIKAGLRLVEQMGIPETPSPSILFLLSFKEKGNP